MSDRKLAAAAALAAALMTIGGARASDDAKYPDWKGQWEKFTAPEIPGQASAGWDQTKPWGLGQQAPLNRRYQSDE
jgi:hypothetical protein